MSTIVDWIDPSTNVKKIVDEHESSSVTVQFQDTDTSPATDIDANDLQTIEMRLYTEIDEEIINGRDFQDVKDANGGVVNGDGTFTQNLNELDNVVMNGAESYQRESHICEFRITWTATAGPKTGHFLTRFPVQKAASPA